MQQAVRSIFGPTNREVGNPSWMSGAFELLRPRRHLEPLLDRRSSRSPSSPCCWFVLKTHRLGLQMRAVTQNRRMASSMGIRTPWVDAMTFGLGSGIAGLAGVALSQIDNVSPNLGQGYIIDSFMVVVFGGVGNLWGTLVGALTLGIAQQVPRALRRRRARQDPRARAHHPVHPEAAARALRTQGKGDRSMITARLLAKALDAQGPSRIAHPAGAVAISRAGVQPAVARQSAARAELHGLAARQIPDLCACWRSRSISSGAICGILSLGHAAFFALGGYAMGMYLMRQIGDARRLRQIRYLPDFMVFLNWKDLPWYWYGFDMFWFAPDGARRAGAARLRLRLVRLPQPRQRRLSVDHHPGDDLRPAARLLPQRHGLRRQQRPDRLQGHSGLHSVQAPARAAALFAASGASPWRSLIVASGIVNPSSARCWSACATRKAARASSATAPNT
jgi:hypothetical protein